MSDHQYGSGRRMPAMFGPSPGPRRWPDGSERRTDPDSRRDTAWASFPVDDAALRALLPDGLSVRGDATLTVQFHTLRNLSWLAGRGYDIVEVSTPVVHDGQDGHFVFVLWENRADPIITGREELGINKVFAEITGVDLGEPSRDLELTASWDGFPFLRLVVRDLRPAPAGTVTTLPRFHHKYVPRTGAGGRPDADYLVVSPPDATARTVTASVGTADLTLTRGTFAQLPTLLHIVDGLASLRRGRCVAAGVTARVGMGTLADQHAIDQHT